MAARLRDNGVADGDMGPARTPSVAHVAPAGSRVAIGNRKD